MSATAQMEVMLQLLLEHAAPRLTGRIDVSVGQQQRVFTVTPGRGSHVSIRFGLQATHHPDLMMIIEEARVAIEAHAYGLTTAAASRLDLDQRWLYEQRQNPCTE